jgi:1-acyl-sn-glycerol-3-phosphate acyltransferase
VRIKRKGLARAPARTINSFIYFIIRAAARIVLAPFFEIQVEGQDNVPKRGSFILLPKHQRWEDIPLLGLASPVPLYYVAKKELFTNRLSSWFMTSLGGIPLDRRRPLASRNSIKAVVELLEDEAGVVVFPEGTYYRNGMGAGRVGLIRLIHSQIEVPYIPVGIRYARRAMRKPVQIKFGRTLPWEPSVEPEEFLASAMQAIGALSGLRP